MRWCVVVSLVLCGCTGSRVGAGDEPDAGALPDAARDASPWPDGCVELGVRDPGFQYEDVWEATGGAKVDVGADGCSSTGAGIFPSEAWCGAGAFSQTVAPCQDWTGRLIKVSLNLVCDEDLWGLCWNSSTRSLALSINGASHVLEPMDLPSTENPWVTYSFCLGERVSAPVVRFGITGFDEPDGDNCSDINSPSSIQVDDLVILPDALGVCPPVGLLGNGDFEAGDDGWDLTDYVEVCAGLGRDGTTGLRLIGAEHGASRLVSVPLPTTLAAPAVEVWVQGDLRSGLTVALGSVVLAALDASDIPAVHRVCVPPWAHGMVLPLDFVTDASFEAVIDDVGLVSESRCGAGLLLDGGFEQTAATPVIHTGWLGSGYHPDSSEGRVVLDPLRARTGDAVGVLSVSKRCRGAHLVTSYQVPSPQGSAGPALRLWYRTVALQQAALSLSSPRVSLPASDTWTQRTVCLSPATAGQLRQLWISFGNSFSGSDCGTAIPPELALVDDVEVTTDPACPATAP